jgi:type II secretory ATPase GspE/PulE/Tfp pilus assembly ATPase PilB-like protein
MKRNSVALLSLEGGRARIAIANPAARMVLQAIGMLFDQALDLVVATDRDIEAALTRSETAEAEAAEPVAAVVTAGDLDADKLTELANNVPTVRYLDGLFARAVESGATDIHIEMLEKGPRVRLRMDGLLVEADAMERHLYEGVVSRLKILAGMDISERRLPQDGRIRQKSAGRSIDFRVASAPTVHGETLVLRLLDNRGARARLESLNLPASVIRPLRAALGQPNGLILMTGPTGSGKTTTLHAALAELNDVGRKIITIENPVEIQTPGLIQIEVKADLGWTFASALRTVLRHDPDVLMVGEIRDAETAELAVRAALTGHLVCPRCTPTGRRMRCCG